MKAVSGGEKKRVSIAVELICDPNIMFLDEPTSGLDNNSSRKLINHLKTISKKGKMVIITVHQPPGVLLTKLDMILLLSQGRTVYLGSMKECKSYLQEN